jgi:hypothetical protein
LVVWRHKLASSKAPWFNLKKERIMIEVFNLEGMPVYKYRAQEEDSFSVSQLEGKGLPCGIYFVRIKRAHGVETAKLLIC